MTEESGHYGEATVIERFEQESKNGLSTQKRGCCREVAVNGSLTVFIQSTPFLVDTQDQELVTSLVRLCNSRSKIQFGWVCHYWDV